MDRPASVVLLGLSSGPVYVHRIGDEKRQAAMCGEFCSFLLKGVILGADRICERCRELAGDEVDDAQRNGRLF